MNTEEYIKNFYPEKHYFTWMEGQDNLELLIMTKKQLAGFMEEYAQSQVKESNDLLNTTQDMYSRAVVQVGELKEQLKESKDLLIDFGIWIDRNGINMYNGNITETVQEYLTSNNKT